MSLRLVSKAGIFCLCQNKIGAMMTVRREIWIILAGATAPFVGVGLGRFAYNPLFPYMVAEGWLLPAGGAYVGAFNLAGYLGGVILARRLAVRAGLGLVLNAAMLLMALSFLACAAKPGLIWFCLWRLIAGLSGGVLMVLAGPAIQATVSIRNQGIAGGAVIAGVGTGIIAGALLAPYLPHIGISIAWFGLAAVITLAWGLTCRLWPETQSGTVISWAMRARAGRVVLVYGLAGAGMVPHMVYLSDLFIRAYGLDPMISSSAWLLFGVGATSGAVIGGRCVDRKGGRATMLAWLWLQIAAVALLLIASGPTALLAGFLGGFGGIGMTGVVLGYAREMHPDAPGGIWASATAAFAIAQAVASFALARLFELSGSHLPVLIAGLVLSIAALVVMLAGGRHDVRRPAPFRS